MFVYLSKKIGMPNGVNVKCLAWNTEQGWLACGGEKGLLKVLKLDSGTKFEEKVGLTEPAPSNLLMNQSLEGHHRTVVNINWNQNYRKLTSSDEDGLIIVWVLHKGMWFEEMINNRNKSTVKDLRWSADGQRICIVYADGQVVMGNVDGNRLWSKNLNIQLALAEWSPDGRLVLLCTREGTCLIYDQYGNYAAQLSMCFINSGPGSVIVAIDWYNRSEGHSNPNTPSLAVALGEGKIQLMRSESDERPTLVDTRMTIVSMKWSPDGEVLAVVGTDFSKDIGTSISMVQLYSNMGTHLRTMPVPGVQTRCHLLTLKYVQVKGLIGT